jgi:hypothetical protein
MTPRAAIKPTANQNPLGESPGGASGYVRPEHAPVARQEHLESARIDRRVESAIRAMERRAHNGHGPE